MINLRGMNAIRQRYNRIYFSYPYGQRHEVMHQEYLNHEETKFHYEQMRKLLTDDGQHVASTEDLLDEAAKEERCLLDFANRN